MQQLGEYALTEAYENIGLDDTFENMVGALKISAAIEKDDIPSAALLFKMFIKKKSMTLLMLIMAEFSLPQIQGLVIIRETKALSF
jgi:hypothetical protein